ncbi:response regulator [Sphingomonas canadensis]|uniref:Response regulator n=1 Tax=Sphingomonas canadensis TaxID=1219257 RepID=A0ABW3HCH2_9SPHN|nr:response regulator transcription factor [Sphingomonas canadensis]MCW3838151.1 response regulator transcription factor [Sphingomonas canadensis]
MTQVKVEVALTPIRVLVVDDHPMLRDGIIGAIERQADMLLVDEAVDGVEAVEKYRLHRPDVTLMDLQMPRMGGIEAIETIRNEFAEATFIVLTTIPGDTQALRAMQAGATGYLLKSCIRKDLIDTIRTVHGGRKRIAHDVAHEIAVHALDERLNEREIEILRLIAEGHQNKQIAWELDITIDSVKASLKAIFAKLDVADRTHAVTVAHRRGFIEL